MRKALRTTFAATAALITAACQTAPDQPLQTDDFVDVDRFMGDWYVIAHIPPFITDEAYNAVESYERNDDGTIATTFRYRDGGFDAELETMTATGFVGDEPSNAIWGMQFIWPIKADYRIVYVDEGYQQTIIGRKQRDYVWIMARTPDIAPEDYQRLVERVVAQGYDQSTLRKVPQRWDDAET